MKPLAPPETGPPGVGRHPRWSPVLLLALSVTLLVGFAAAYEVSAPIVHDEYAYLLSADTFAAGRLTNDTHPLWKHFETFHVFHHPTYQAKYPPGQAMALALGIVLGGHAIVGVWLSWALALVAVHWLLRAAFPERWALLGTFLLLCNAYLFRTWGQTYWGGAVAALGGALLFGGLLRLRDRLATVDGLAMAAGLFVLANSRPFEGLLVAGLSSVFFLVAVRRWYRRGEGRAVARRTLLPVGAGIAALVLWTLVYDAVLTGNPFLLPYFNYDNGRSLYEDIRSYTGSPERSIPGKARRLVASLLGYPVALAFPFVLLRRRAVHVQLAALVVCLLGFVVVVWTRAWPHYVAPIVGLVALLAVAALRGLAGLRWRGRPTGAVLVVLVLAVHFGVWLWETASLVHRGPLESWARDRARMIEELAATGRKHLVLVRYGPGRERNRDWVYNEADIDAAPVVWARDRGDENAALFEYFDDREVWLLEVPPDRPQLVPFRE